MQSTLASIRANPRRDGSYSPNRLAAIANLESGIARFQATNAQREAERKARAAQRSVTITTWHREKLMTRADDPKLPQAMRDHARHILDRKDGRMTPGEAQDL